MSMERAIALEFLRSQFNPGLIIYKPDEWNVPNHKDLDPSHVSFYCVETTDLTETRGSVVAVYMYVYGGTPSEYMKSLQQRLVQAVAKMNKDGRLARKAQVVAVLQWATARANVRYGGVGQSVGYVKSVSTV